MRWSKLKQTLEGNFADCLQYHLKVHSTVYRDKRNEDGRVWFEWDKKELLEFSDWAAYNWARLQKNGYASGYGNIWANDSDFSGYGLRPPFLDKDREPDILHQKEEFSRLDFKVAAKKYLDMSVEDAINSENPIFQSLAILDKRIGKRRLQKYLNEDWHPLVKFFLYFRAEKEGLRLKNST